MKYFVIYWLEEKVALILVRRQTVKDVSTVIDRVDLVTLDVGLDQGIRYLSEEIVGILTNLKAW